MNTYIDIHIIHSLPPSCLNRDDAGSPKTSMYGGTRRLRVSSQAWKRATREYFRDHMDSSFLGWRTSRVVEKLANIVAEREPSLADRAEALAVDVFTTLKIKIEKPAKKGKEESSLPESKYLIFLSNNQMDVIADYVIAAALAGEKIDVKKVKQIFTSKHAIDVALFGRMIADSTDLNVDASCQVAHAISTHTVETEYDFFSAVDDEKEKQGSEDAGAGMLGIVEFSSATMYRYATINTELLEANLGDREATLRAISAFIEAFTHSLPTGKQNTFAAQTMPHTVVVQIRDDKPVSLAGAFEKPVRWREGEGYLLSSLKEMITHEKDMEEHFGLVPRESFVVSIAKNEDLTHMGKRVKLNDLAHEVCQALGGSTEQS